MSAKSFPLALALAAASVTAQAQEFVRPDCQAFVQPTASLAFMNLEHRTWYRRFWTGDCRGLPALRCVPGSPNWNDTVARLVSKGRPDQAAAITAQACRLGQAIGHEWSRPKPVRRIDTEALKGYFKIFDSAPDVTSGIARVDQRVRAALGKP